MKPTPFIPFLAVTAFLLVGCTGSEIFNSSTGLNNHFISFSTQLPATRAAAYEETGDNAYTSMGVYATVSGYYNLMTNQHVTRINGSNGWTYTPNVEWPAESVSFYAYAPYGRITTGQNGDGKMPVVNNFTVATTSEGKAVAQVDLLMAESVSNAYENLTADVQLTMRHVLTRVCFSARTHHPYATGVTSIQITKVELTGLKNQGTHNIDARDFWTTQSINNAVSNTYTLTSTGGGLAPTDLSNTTLANITTNDGNLYLMPQVLTDNTAKISITVATTTGSNNTVEKTFTYNLIDMLDEFKQGEALRFLLTAPNAADPEPFQIEVTHDDWNADYNIDADIERDPVLYISNETVYAYDGAVTCIYFSSNIPPNASDHPTDANGYNDIIYIEDEGRIGSNTGATFSVKDEFYAIAKSDPDREYIKLGHSAPHINNLRYESDGTGRYKGHIDIVQRKTTAAGETPNQAKQPLILKLHVGKLVRDITVQRIVTTEAAKQNPTRYVGTFHRHHETGERIVTWYEDENTRWRVEKDTTIGKNSDWAELQLDTRISPDFRNKQLYSLVARDPEGTRVEQNDNLFGRGRVYFRVGWKTPTTGTNRYARIKVSLWKDQTPVANANTPPTEIHYLYCRQGDTEEQIAQASSQYALYNVSTPRQFSRYPSQTGMLYQWNRLVPWSPLGEAAPYGWNTNPLDYETVFDYQRSACPDGYVYPSTPQETELKTVFSAGTGTLTARGYYADGYFDRRAITYNGASSTAKNEHRVNASNLEVGSIGTILFNDGKLGYAAGEARSIFLVSGGYRNVDPFYSSIDGGLLANADHDDDHGVHGGYWFDISEGITQNALGAIIFKGTNANFIKNYPKRNAHSIRCVRAKGWMFVFNTNGGENGPHNMTIPNTETSITIPATVPNNYYRDNHEFKGWTKERNGSGTLYKAGQVGVNLATEFGPATNPASRVELYAKWEIPTDIIDFRTLGVPENYLYDISSSTADPYANLTANSNGTKYSEATTRSEAESYFNNSDKAYPILEFSHTQPSTNFTTAYEACKNMSPAGSWRLPRAQEVVLIQIYTTKADHLLGDKNEGIWTGTTATSNGYLFSFRNYNRYTSATIVAKPYRCVRPAAP